MPLPSVPSPRTWGSGPILVRNLRGDVANAVQFLANRPQFYGQNTLGTAFGTGVVATIPFNISLIDNWQGYGGPGYYAQAPGWYLANGGVAWGYNAGTAHQFIAGVNGTTGGVAYGPSGPLSPNASIAGALPQVTDLVLATATGPPGGSGDFMELNSFQDSGGTLNLGNALPFCPYLQVRWVANTSGTEPLVVPPNAAFPVPPNYVTSAWLNANIRDTINFLTYPPIARAHYTPGSLTLASSTFPAGSSVAPALNTVDVDNYGGFSSGVYTAPVAGIYLVYLQATVAGTTSTISLSAGFSINGGTTQWCATNFSTATSGLAGANSGSGVYARRRIRLNAGDTITPMASQGTGAAIAYHTVAFCQTRMIVVWEGA